MAKDFSSSSDFSKLRRQAEEAEGQSQDRQSARGLSPEEAAKIIHELKVHQIELQIQNDELRKVQDELEASRDRYIDLYDRAPVGYLTLDKTGTVVKANLTASRLLGVERGRLIRKPLSSMVLPADNYAFNLHVKNIFQGDSPLGAELRFVGGNSTCFAGLLESVAVSDTNDVIIECRSVLTDITKQKQFEDSLLRELEINRAIADMMVPLLSPAYTIGDVGKAFFQKAKQLTQSQHGYVNETQPETMDQVALTLSEMLGKDCRIDGSLPIKFPVGSDGLYPGLWGHSLNTRKSFFTNSPSGHFSSKGLPVGHVPLKNFLSVPVIHNDELVGQIALANSPRDYDEKDIEVIQKLSRYFALGLLRKRYEETQTQLTQAIDQAAEAVAVVDAEGIAQYVNPAYEKITGYMTVEVVGRKPRFLDPEYNEPETVENIWKATTNGSTWTGSFRGVHKEGAFVDIRLSIAPVMDDRGKTKKLVAVFSDVTEETKLQNQLFQSQKMEAVGTLANGIAHDFNNILQVVLGYTEQLEDDEEMPLRFKQQLGTVIHAALSGADLVNRLMLFSRKAVTNLKQLDINEQILQIKKLLGRTVHKNIEIETVLPKEIYTIKADPIQIEQVIMNLVLNARDAMPSGGKIMVETRNVLLDSAFCANHVGVSPGRYVSLKISDNGSGIPEDVLPHIFEPFFTTKAPGHGTGLGLSTVHGIVNSHGGIITCESKFGHGTTFNVYLPVIDAPQLHVKVLEKTSPLGGSETILVVDDEEFVRNVEEDILRSVGYQVITASDGADAWEIYQAKQDSIMLTILDILMPRMGGVQCMKLILEMNPSAKILTCSGLTRGTEPEELLRAGARGHIYKPYKKDLLLKKVREILDQD